MQKITEKVVLNRVTFLVDEETYKFLSKAHSDTESDEIWIWEKSEEVEVDIHKPCEDCGSRFMMEEYACTNNEGYCLDCCFCEEHYPKPLDTIRQN